MPVGPIGLRAAHLPCAAGRKWLRPMGLQVHLESGAGTVHHHPHVSRRHAQLRADLVGRAAPSVRHHERDSVSGGKVLQCTVQIHQKLRVAQAARGVGAWVVVSRPNAFEFVAVADRYDERVAPVSAKLVHHFVTQDAEQPGPHAPRFVEFRWAFKSCEQGLGDSVFGPNAIAQAGSGCAQQQTTRPHDLADKWVLAHGFRGASTMSD